MPQDKESLCVRVSKKEGEDTRRRLIELGAINPDLRIKSDKGDLLIPVLREINGFEVEKGDFELLKKEKTLKEVLGFAPAFEQIGDIAIIERNAPQAQKIADILIGQKKIKTVLQAVSEVRGEYRTRVFSILAGEKRTVTLYRENGCRYFLDLAQVYFTPRLSTERMRIANQIKDGDRIVDMFAGVGPFSILIAKKFPGVHVVAIDKNRFAIKYLKENVKLNKVNNVEVREGDVRDAIGGISGADHVIMNLPHRGMEFLNAAFQVIKRGGLIHLYAIMHEDDLFDGALRKIEEAARKFSLRVIPVDKRIVKPYAPYQYNICIDFRVE